MNTKWLRKLLPEPVKRLLRPVKYRFFAKNDLALEFWKSRHELDNGHFRNDYYEEIMLKLAMEESHDFIKGRIVADFGCGPRGSLCWAKEAYMRVGIDVLADRYADEFRSDMLSHDMLYVKSTEKTIPIPSNFIDIMFTLNAIDHVDNFEAMCREIIRVLKPGGEFLGSFNLEEPSNPYEPQRLSEKIIKENLLVHMEVKSYRISFQGAKENRYEPFFTDKLEYEPGKEGILWVRATLL